MPEFAQYRQRGAVESVAPLDAPNQIRVAGSQLGALGHQLGAGFLQPAEAAFFAELGFEQLGERMEEPGISTTRR